MVIVLFGICYGSILGGFIVIEIGNIEWFKWEIVMVVDLVDFVELVDVVCNVLFIWLWLGYVDYVGMFKYGFDDVWLVLEWVSVCEIVVWVVVGMVVWVFLR